MSEVLLTVISEPTLVTVTSGTTTQLTVASGDVVVLGLQTPGVQGPQGPGNYIHPNHSGEVTSSGDGATVIASGVVTNAKLAPVASGTIKARISAGSGSPEDITASQLRTLLNVADGAQVNVATDLSYTASTRLLESSTGTDVTLPLVSLADAGLQPPLAFDALAYSGTVDLDMAALNGTYKTISMTGPLTLTTSNRSNGKVAVIRLISDGSSRAFVFPSGWSFLGTKPDAIAPSKTAVLSITYFGSADSDCVAAYGVQA
jgi:hypothetical protein